MTSKPIRRPSRLRAVWLSYWTRWQLWLVMALSMIPFSIIVPSYWEASPNMVKSAEPAAPAPQPSGSVFHHEYDQPINWSTLRSLTITEVAKCEPLWIPGKAPKLESLSVMSSVTDEQLAKLCELYDLKAFTLYSPETLTAAGWKHLAGEPSLHYLRLYQLQSLRHEPSLEWPRNLQTLICYEPHGVSLQRLEEWQQLPLLTTLGTLLVPRDQDRLTAKELDTLRRFPGLRSLYLVEMGKHAPNYVAVQQAALPSLRVRPANYHPERGKRATVILVGGLLVLVVLSIQLSSQFVTTASVLTPHFARSHLNFVVGIFVVLLVVTFGLLVWAGCSVFVALSLSGSSALLLAVGVKSVSLMSGNQLPGFCNFAIAMPSVVFPVMGVVLGLALFGADFDWFLSGRQPWLLMIVLAGSLWGAFELVSLQTNLRRRLEESGTANVPMGMFDTRGWIEWTNNLAALRTGQGKKETLPYRLYDARMDHFVEQHQARKSTALVALWRLGGQSTSDMLRFTVIALVAILLFVGAPIALLAPDWWSQFGPIIVAPMVFQLLGGGLIMPLFFAWGRRPMQELELLHPMSRRDWAGTWFQGVASEIAPVLIALLGFSAVLLWTGLLGNWSVPQAALAAIILVGGLANVFAVGMWTLTLRSLWQVMLVGVALWIAIVLLVVSPILVSVLKLNWQSPAILIPTIVALYSVASVELWLAWRRWQNWEVGQAT